MNGLVEVRNAEVGGRLVDVAWCDGVVLEVSGPAVRRPGPGSVVVDAGGGALIPGLHDHHIHVLALAAARQSVRVGPPEVTTIDGLAEVLSAASATATSGWVRAVGYHESVAGDIDAASLDRLVPAGRDVAIRVQHRSGQLWVLNGHAVATARLADLADLGVERDATGAPTGRVFGLDDRLRDRIPATPLDIAALGRELASYGVTGVTDLTPTESSLEVETLARHVTDPAFPIRVTVTGGPALDPRAAPTLERGPIKFLPADHRVPDVDRLSAGIDAAHRTGRPVAVHCVTRIGLVIALAAWREGGVRRGDRIEHGGVIPAELLDDIDDLGLTVVTQPNFVAERGDHYVTDVEPDDRPHLWRCASLLDHGIGVAGGTDAPFGHPDPWRAIDAAIRRRTRSGALLGKAERVDPATALRLFLGAPHHPTARRVVEAGTAVDLCLLDRCLDDALAGPSASHVRLTIGRAGIVPAAH